MSFGAPDAPAAPPPPPNPPQMASASIQNSGAQARMAAAAAAGKQVFEDTLATSSQGAPVAPSAPKQLLGQ